MDIIKALAISANGMAAQTARLQGLAEDLTRDRVAGPSTVRGTHAQWHGRSCSGMPPTQMDTTDTHGDASAQDLGRPAMATATSDDVPPSGANLGVLEAARGLLTRTIDLLG